MDAVVKYIDGLLEKSTPDAPVWNIEKIKQGLKSKWNYIDGCMIKAVLQMYDLTKEEKYLKFADDFIDYRVFEDGTIDGYRNQMPLEQFRQKGQNGVVRLQRPNNKLRVFFIWQTLLA